MSNFACFNNKSMVFNILCLNYEEIFIRTNIKNFYIYSKAYILTINIQFSLCNEDESSKAKESAEQREGKTSTSSTNGESTTTKKRANETEEKQKSITKTKKSRQYRQRAIETYESDSETETNKKELKKDETVVSPVYKEADRIEVQEPEEKKQRLDKKDVNTVENITNTKDKDENVKDTEIPQNNNVTPKSEEVENKEKYVEKKDRSSIWEKRTVGTVFEAALQRYYARKAKGLAEAN